MCFPWIIGGMAALGALAVAADDPDEDNKKRVRKVQQQANDRKRRREVDYHSRVSNNRRKREEWHHQQLLSLYVQSKENELSAKEKIKYACESSLMPHRHGKKIEELNKKIDHLKSDINHAKGLNIGELENYISKKHIEQIKSNKKVSDKDVSKQIESLITRHKL